MNGESGRRGRSWGRGTDAVDSVRASERKRSAEWGAKNAALDVVGNERVLTGALDRDLVDYAQLRRGAVLRFFYGNAVPDVGGGGFGVRSELK